MKLNELIKSHKVTVYGFPAFKGLEALGNPEGNEIVVSVLSPVIMLDKGISTYYAPVIPRNSRFNTTQEVVDADLDVNLVSVFDYTSHDLALRKTIIVSRHRATIDILRKLFPDALVLSGNVSADDLRGCHIVGTLPPALIADCESYRAVTIDNYNAVTDGDLTAEEIIGRLNIGRRICVEVQ